MLAEGRGEGKVFIRYLCYNGELGGGGRGLGITGSILGRRGRRAFDHDHQHIPIHLCQFSRDGSNFSLITEWRSNGVTSLAIGIWGWVAWVCFIFLIILSRGSIYQSINQSINRCGLHCFWLVVQSYCDNLPISSSSSSSSSSSYYHFIWLCINIYFFFSYGLL